MLTSTTPARRARASRTGHHGGGEARERVGDGIADELGRVVAAADDGETARDRGVVTERDPVGAVTRRARSR